MSVQNVPQQTPGTSYGILIYDIPKENEKLYYKVQTKIRRKAIRLNLSVYLLLWGMRGEVEKIIDEAQAETGQYASVFFAMFDNSEEEHILRAAKESLLAEMKRIAKRLVANVKKSREKAEKEGREYKHISEGYAYKIKHKLEEAEALAMLFGLTRDVKYAMESVQKSFAAEMEKILAERKEKKRSKKKAKRKAVSESKKAAQTQEPDEGVGGSMLIDPNDVVEHPITPIPPEKEFVQETAPVEMDDDVDTVEVDEDNGAATPEQTGEMLQKINEVAQEVSADGECEDPVDVPDGDGNPASSWTDPV